MIYQLKKASGSGPFFDKINGPADKNLQIKYADIPSSSLIHQR
jgi:hypothetical protein